MSTSASADAASSIASAVGVGIVSTPCGAIDLEIRCEQDHLRTPAARLLRQCDAHASRRPVAEETDAVEWFPRAACGDEHSLARERSRGQQLLDTPRDLLRLGEAA